MIDFCLAVFFGILSLNLLVNQAKMEKRIEILENDVEMLLELELKK